MHGWFPVRSHVCRMLFGTLAAAVLLSGCVSDALPGGSGAEEAVAEPLRAPAVPPGGPFSPPFELVAPQVRVLGDGEASLEVDAAGGTVSLMAVFPPEAGVDASKVTAYLWRIGDVAFAGAEVRYAPDAPGVVRIELTVHDAYGRSATALHELDVR